MTNHIEDSLSLPLRIQALMAEFPARCWLADLHFIRLIKAYLTAGYHAT